MDINEVKKVVEDVVEQKVGARFERLEDKLDTIYQEKVRILKVIEDSNERHEKDMEEIKPVLQAYNGVSIAGNGIKWVAGVGTALGVLWLMLKGIIMYK